MKINFPPECQKYIDLQCNGDRSLYEDFPEQKHLLPYLEKVDPHIVMDIGAGLGRASVWIANKMGWKDRLYLFLDGNQGNKQFEGIRKEKGEFYNNWHSSLNFCRKNGLERITCISPDELSDKLLKHYGYENIKIDLVYSFLAVGFHWGLDFYLDDIYPYLADKCLLAFGMRGEEKKKWCMNQVKRIDSEKYELIDLKLKPKSTKESLLVLRKR